MAPAQITIPPEVLSGLPLLVQVLLLLAIPATPALWLFWTSERAERRKAQAARDAETKAAAEAFTEQRVLNERSIAAMGFKDWQIAQLEKQVERCERELDRERESTRPERRR